MSLPAGLLSVLADDRLIVTASEDAASLSLPQSSRAQNSGKFEPSTQRTAIHSPIRFPNLSPMERIPTPFPDFDLSLDSERRVGVSGWTLRQQGK
jgi:hypothetical protein